MLTATTNNLTQVVTYDISPTAELAKVYAPTTCRDASGSLDQQHAWLQPSGAARDGGPHVCEFSVHGLDVANLPSTDMSISSEVPTSLIQTHKVAKATFLSSYAR